jgi:tetratricopeptide (TPR) repeat protein
MRQYDFGNCDVIESLAAEEANLLHAHQLAHRHGWWNPVIGTMQGLRVLYDHTGRRAEWARLVAEIVPAFVDPQTDGPLPGLEEHWGVVTEYRVRLAREIRNWPEAERLQRVCVEWDRRRAENVVRSLWNGADGSRREPATFLEGLKVVAARLTNADRSAIRSLGVSLHGLGEIQRECQHQTCVAAYEEAFGVAELIGNRPGAANVALNLGNAYKNIPAIRDLPQAERWYRRSLELFDERDRLGRGKCLGQLGCVAFERFREARSAGRPEVELVDYLNTALGFYHQSLDLLPESAVNEVAITHNALGAIYGEAGDIDRALPHYREAIRYHEGAGNVYGAATNPLQRRLGPGRLRPRARCPRVRPRRAPQLRNLRPRRRRDDPTHPAVARRPGRPTARRQ